MIGAVALQPRLAAARIRRGVAGGAALGLLVGTYAFASLGLFLAGVLRAEATLAAANLVYLLLLAGGAVVLPANAYGGAGHALTWLPSGALGEAMRAALTHGHVAGGSLLVLAPLGSARHRPDREDVHVGVSRAAGTAYQDLADRARPHLRALGWATLVANIGIVVTGGAVRLTASGLGCPTWPRCNGGRVHPARHAVACTRRSSSATARSPSCWPRSRSPPSSPPTPRHAGPVVATCGCSRSSWVWRSRPRR